MGFDGEGWEMLLVLALLVVLLVAGFGFALHVLWIVAAVLLVLWLVGFVVGRGESAGSRHFYRW
jgi:energy-coupling factor transporter transmembrane protein EcfT